MSKKLLLSLVLFSALFVGGTNLIKAEVRRNIFLFSPVPSASVQPSVGPSATPKLIRRNLLNIVKNKVQERAWIHEAAVTEINGTILTVIKDGNTYTVLTDTNTAFKRRFGGKSTISEISKNDKLDILGKWNNDQKTEILTTHIRDLSIQIRFATFFGKVKSINGNIIVVTTEKRGEQTVTIETTTKLVNRKMEVITTADILSGHLIRIKGLWDSANSTVTEVKQIKDFTLPVVKPSASPQPSSSPQV